jgi:hypothetical protein
VIFPTLRVANLRDWSSQVIRTFLVGQLELRSIEVSGVTCAVREGNVFTQS